MIFALTPDQAILLLTAGVLLVFLELNRPGWIIPGTIGLSAVLIAVAALIHDGIHAGAFLLCGSAVAVLARSLRRAASIVLYAAATVALTLGLATLSPLVHACVAVPCGTLLGAGTSVLTRIARRARANKGLD